MTVPFGHVLLFAGFLFLMGAACAVSRRNLVMILLGVEIMLNAAAIVLVAASLRWMRPDGQLLVLFIMGTAAAGVSIGLALIIHARRRTGSVDADRFNSLRG